MVPAWKLRRELRRLGMQAGRLPWYIRAPIAKRRYDARRAELMKVSEGAAPRTGALAILLLYQPRGVSPTTLHTVDHFREQGVATLVVSNAPLSDADRAALRARSWRVIERPNFGYDFGGYRDGILHLIEEGITPERLFVLNNSIWFPVSPGSDLVAEAMASEADLFGFVLNDRIRGEDRDHIQSYFFVFGPRLLAHPDFEAHWRGLFLTDNKDLVIRRCEIPMTAAFRSRGHSIAFRHTYADAVAALAGLDNETLRRVIAYQARVDTRHARELSRHLGDGAPDAEWRARVDRDIAGGLFDRYFLIAHPAVLFGEIGIPLLKKDRQDIYRLQRAELIAGGYDSGFVPVIRDEIRGWDGRA